MSRKTPLLGTSGMQRAMAFTVVAACLAATGCTALVQPIDAVPSDRVPPEFLARPRANKVPIDLARLRQEPPAEYLLDAGDVLGIAIESILGKEGEPPPTHFPEVGSDLPPAIGFPIPINEDGSISLPLVPAIPVKGLTLTQARELIRKAYMEDQKILREDRVIVTLIRERRIRVTVVREDNVLGGNNNANQNAFGSGVVTQRLDQSGRGFVVDLPAYKNDVLEALAKTGGLPGLNAKAEVKILRGKRSDFQARDQFIAEFYRQYYQNPDPCGCPPPLPDDPSIVKIPLRLEPGQIPTFSQEDIILEEGDIVYVEGREAEVFYAGGLLRGGEIPLPRDYDLDVLGAIALAGGSVGAFQGQGGGLGIQPGVTGAPPGEAIILRKLPCGQQIAISVNLTDAVNNPAARPLIQPGDTVILRYRPGEEILNFSIGTFFVYGIRELFN